MTAGGIDRLAVQPPINTLSTQTAEQTLEQALDTVGGFLVQAAQPEVVAHHKPGMIAQRGRSFFHITKDAHKTYRPKRIITSDGPNPREIDDGVFVEELPTATEMYRVGVCLPDTSAIIRKQEVLSMGMRRLHAEYGFSGEGCDEAGYRPYIPPRFIRRYEMSEGHERDALVLRFIVGQNQPPSELSVSFEKVFVERNLDYRQLTEQSKPSKQYERYARAGRYLLEHMQYTGGYDSEAVMQADSIDMVRHLVEQQPERLHLAATRLTTVMMIAANTYGQRVLEDAGRAQINRVFDPNATDFSDFIPNNVASYSLTPSIHQGLGLKVATITSPLRRIQDAINGYQHWKLAQGLRQDGGDIRLLEEVTRSLNYEISSNQVDKKLRAKYADQSESYVDDAIQEELEELADLNEAITAS